MLPSHHPEPRRSAGRGRQPVTPAATHTHSNASVAATVQSEVQMRGKAGARLTGSFLTVCAARETHMDNELLKLANGLRLAAGMIMESNDLVAAGRFQNADDLAARLQALATAGDDIATLAAAAQVLIRLG